MAEIYDINLDTFREVTQQDVDQLVAWQQILGRVLLEPKFAGDEAIQQAKRDWRESIANWTGQEDETVTVASFIRANKDTKHILAMRPAVLVETKEGFEMALFEGNFHATVEVDGDDLQAALANLNGAVKFAAGLGEIK